jgi:sulfatase maturation enzyme AslB (radical SAM superfamily)
VSVDGPRELHDQIRGRGQLARLADGVRAVASGGIG